MYHFTEAIHDQLDLDAWTRPAYGPMLQSLPNIRLAPVVLQLALHIASGSAPAQESYSAITRHFVCLFVCLYIKSNLSYKAVFYQWPQPYVCSGLRTSLVYISQFPNQIKIPVFHEAGLMLTRELELKETGVDLARQWKQLGRQALAQRLRQMFWRTT